MNHYPTWIGMFSGRSSQLILLLGIQACCGDIERVLNLRICWVLNLSINLSFFVPPKIIVETVVTLFILYDRSTLYYIVEVSVAFNDLNIFYTLALTFLALHYFVVGLKKKWVGVNCKRCTTLMGILIIGKLCGGRRHIGNLCTFSVLLWT